LASLPPQPPYVASYAIWSWQKWITDSLSWQNTQILALRAMIESKFGMESTLVTQLEDYMTQLDADFQALRDGVAALVASQQNLDTQIQAAVDKVNQIASQPTVTTADMQAVKDAVTAIQSATTDTTTHTQTIQNALTPSAPTV
jgi:phage shock protein A